MSLNQSKATNERLEEALLRQVVDTAPDGLIIIDESGAILSFNPAAVSMFGYREDEIRGRNIDLLMPSPYAEQHDGYIERYVETGVKHIIGIGREVQAKKKDGTVFPVELAVGEVISEGKRLFTGFVRDLTERRKSEKRIARLQDELVHVARLSAMGELATTLAHELNQPLTAIANYLLVARQLVGDLPDSERALEFLEKAAQQAQRGGETIRSIRGFVRDQDSEPSREDLNDAIEEAVKIGAIGAERHRIAVDLMLDDDLPQVLIDRIQIQQVVTNLVRNAVDALAASSQTRRRITVSTGAQGHDAVCVEVRDNGPGISPKIDTRLFSAFNSSKPQGVGIGLAISKNIIAAHRGRIKGVNLDEGGACFSFTIPRDIVEK